MQVIDITPQEIKSKFSGYRFLLFAYSHAINHNRTMMKIHNALNLVLLYYFIMYSISTSYTPLLNIVMTIIGCISSLCIIYYYFIGRELALKYDVICKFIDKKYILWLNRDKNASFKLFSEDVENSSQSLVSLIANTKYWFPNKKWKLFGETMITQRDIRYATKVNAFDKEWWSSEFKYIPKFKIYFNHERSQEKD